MTMYNVKGVVGNDEPTGNNHPALQFLSALAFNAVQLGFMTCNFPFQMQHSAVFLCTCPGPKGRSTNLATSW